jgi:hypothetical protein
MSLDQLTFKNNKTQAKPTSFQKHAINIHKLPLTTIQVQSKNLNGHKHAITPTKQQINLPQVPSLIPCPYKRDWVRLELRDFDLGLLGMLGFFTSSVFLRETRTWVYISKTWVGSPHKWVGSGCSLLH